MRRLEIDMAAESRTFLIPDSKIVVPDRNQEAAITSIQRDFGKGMEARHEPELRGGFVAMAKKRNICFTS